jgi:hypothetical protein
LVTLLDTVIVAIISGLIGFVPTFFTVYVKVRKDLEFEYDKDLRKLRIEAYKDLWSTLSAMPQYWLPDPVTYSDLQKLMANLQKWYFEKGGFFFSEKSRRAYFDLMGGLREKAKESNAPLDPNTEYDPLRQLGSNLRNCLAADVGTRQPPRLGYKSKPTKS